MTTPPTTSWEDEFCRKFGLCSAGGRCDCKKQLLFIRKTIASEREEAKREVLSGVKENWGSAERLVKYIESQEAALTQPNT